MIARPFFALSRTASTASPSVREDALVAVPVRLQPVRAVEEAVERGREVDGAAHLVAREERGVHDPRLRHAVHGLRHVHREAAVLLVGDDRERRENGREVVRGPLEPRAVLEGAGLDELLPHERPHERLREAADREAQHERAPVLKPRDERHERGAGERRFGRLGRERAVVADAREEEAGVFLLVLEEDFLLSLDGPEERRLRDVEITPLDRRPPSGGRRT